MMQKTTISDFRDESVVIDMSDSRVTISEDGIVAVSSSLGGKYDSAIYDSQDITGVKVVVNGLASSYYSSAIDFLSAGASVTVGATGVVDGASGVSLGNVDSALVNHGKIIGTSSVGVSLAPGAVDNSGVIMGADVGIMISGGTIVNDEGGRIYGGNIGIEALKYADTTLTNNGTVGTKSGAQAYVGGVLVDTIVNHGTMIGDIDLGEGSDTIDTRGGIIKGDIYGGIGDDILVTDNAKYSLVEDAGEGTDQVKSTVSYTLNLNVEQLHLMGSKNINGTGVDGQDYEEQLFGNSGDNKLNGRGGLDDLFGGAGTDTLTGGAGSDLFAIGKGYDKDTVTDFSVADKDVIDILGYKGIDSFDDIQSHIEKHKSDVWIDMGHGDVLVLEHTKLGDLTANSFLYDYHG